MLSSFAGKLVFCLGLTVAIPMGLLAQSGYVPEGGEYSIAGPQAGDQVNADVSLGPDGGYLVWEDNVTDGSGQGISMRQIDSSLSGAFSVSRVNVQGAGDQQKPRVATLTGGGAVFVWQGGSQTAQQIYARFRSSSNTWVTAQDVLVNPSTTTNYNHLDPAVATLKNGSVVIVYSCFDEDGSMQGVFGQRFSSSGTKLGGEFQVNVTTNLNQRTPAVAGLSDGSFVTVWVSETQVTPLSYDVSLSARRYDANGQAMSGEFKVNTGTNVCANPSIAASPNGGFAVAWGEKDTSVLQNGWDTFARVFSNNGLGGSVQRLNTMQYNDQYAPKIAVLGNDYLTVWTSVGQDGSREGVYGQFIRADGSLTGGEFRVNTTVVSRQIFPAVASDGESRLLAVWSSFVGGGNSVDLIAQRYVVDSQPLNPPAPPMVTVLSSNALSLTWPALDGLSVSNFEVYADGASTPTATITENWWTMTNLTASSTHRFQLAYVLMDGRRSPLSSPATNTTYSALSYGGIPYDWMAQYFGPDAFKWPSPNDDSDGDGVSNAGEFLMGTVPTDQNSVLRERLDSTSQGLFLTWNTQPGLIYQVQVAANFGPWANLGGPRFAAGYVDSLYVGGSTSGYYRIVRLR